MNWARKSDFESLEQHLVSYLICFCLYFWLGYTRSIPNAHTFLYSFLSSLFSFEIKRMWDRSPTTSFYFSLFSPTSLTYPRGCGFYHHTPHLILFHFFFNFFTKPYPISNPPHLTLNNKFFSSLHIVRYWV